jgi:hypothetical protein
VSVLSRLADTLTPRSLLTLVSVKRRLAEYNLPYDQPEVLGER